MANFETIRKNGNSILKSRWKILSIWILIRLIISVLIYVSKKLLNIVLWPLVTNDALEAIILNYILGILLAALFFPLTIGLAGFVLRIWSGERPWLLYISKIYRNGAILFKAIGIGIIYHLLLDAVSLFDRPGLPIPAIICITVLSVTIRTLLLPAIYIFMESHQKNIFGIIKMSLDIMLPNFLRYIGFIIPVCVVAALITLPFYIASTVLGIFSYTLGIVALLPILFMAPYIEFWEAGFIRDKIRGYHIEIER